MATTDETIVRDLKASLFERLAAIDVGPHIEKKNGLSYLSWAWAWDYLLRQDPDASFEYLTPHMFDDGTQMVYCAVTAFGKTRTAHLPVMDHRNNAIANPNAFQVNTAMQRAFVKAIALHGLGLYIYAGEDLPEGSEKEEVPTATVKADAKTKRARLMTAEAKAAGAVFVDKVEPMESGNVQWARIHFSDGSIVPATEYGAINLATELLQEPNPVIVTTKKNGKGKTVLDQMERWPLKPVPLAQELTASDVGF